MRRRRLATTVALSLACCAAVRGAAPPAACSADSTLGAELLAAASTPASVQYVVALRRELHSTPEARARACDARHTWAADATAARRPFSRS
jgi:hypothetical protein